MAILVIFLLGIGNFAMHKAVLESRHPMFAESRAAKALGGKASLVAEFVILLAAMLLVANDYPGWGWAYLAYSAMNALAAWLVLTRRI